MTDRWMDKGMPYLTSKDWYIKIEDYNQNIDIKLSALDTFL